MVDATRRALLGTAVAGAGAFALAACAAEPTARPSASAGTESSSASAAPSESASGEASSGGQDLGAVSEVPVGGGKTFTLGEESILVTQPRSGEFRAFSAVCTHQGCIIMDVIANEAQCNCHGAKFDGESGAVLGGPAQRALKSYTVAVENDRILINLA